MPTLAEPRERVLSLAAQMSDLQLFEAANYMQYIRQKDDRDMRDLVKASEGTLDFWDNDDDKVWDYV